MAERLSSSCAASRTLLRTPGGCCLTYKFTHQHSPANCFVVIWNLEIIPCEFFDWTNCLLWKAESEPRIWWGFSYNCRREHQTQRWGYVYFFYRKCSISRCSSPNTPFVYHAKAIEATAFLGSHSRELRLYYLFLVLTTLLQPSSLYLLNTFKELAKKLSGVRHKFLRSIDIIVRLFSTSLVKAKEIWFGQIPKPSENNLPIFPHFSGVREIHFHPFQCEFRYKD